jgi:hypothetical protein
MNKDFVPYQPSFDMKELGFDEPCIGNYFHTKELKIYGGDILRIKNSDMGTVTAPTFSQAFRWFREKYGYYYEIFVDDDKTFGFMISYFIEIGRADKPIQRMYTTYEEAELECLKKLIEIVKNK